MNEPLQRLRRLNVFISSPADVHEERQAAIRVIESLNDFPHVASRCVMSPLAYEDTVPPAVGGSPQSMVDRYMVEAGKSDLVICILWHRMGTPVKHPATDEQFQSGTEYEFMDAYRAQRERGKPVILLYRSMKSIPADADLEQAKSVQNFFKKFQAQSTSIQGLYRTFKTMEEFRDNLMRDILTVLERDLLSPVAGKETSTAPPNARGEEEKAGSSDIRITSVSNRDRILPLAGHPILISRSGGKPLYTGGFRVSFTLSHNQKGPHSIIVKGMQLNVLSFVAGEHDGYSYAIEGDEIIGAGIARPHEFSLSLFGKRVDRATWVLQAESGTVAVARSANFFNTENPRYLMLRANSDDLEEIIGTVLCQETGLYEVAFLFSYSVAGEDHETTTDTILVYFER